MADVWRRVTYRLYPKPRQLVALERQRCLHQQLYNALLEQRISAWRRQRKTLGYFEQCREITTLRREMVEYEQLQCMAQRITAKRVHLAYQAFFRRARQKGGRAGFPRFKSLRRYPGFGYQKHGNGWRLHTGEGLKHGHLRLAGVGVVRIRGQARLEGEPRACEIVLKNGHWYASIVLACKPKRKRGRAKIGMDWGVKTFATIAHAGGRIETIENPKILQQAETRLKRAQRALSRKKRGSKNREKARQQVAKLYEKVANKRQNFLHQISAVLIASCRVIVTEKLQVQNMTKSAKGTVEEPGKNVQQKAGLNRNILDTAPAAFLQMLRYKAEEAGTIFIEVDTRRWAPSQTCYRCKKRKKKHLSERVHVCECGVHCDRDENAARFLVGLLGRKPARCGGTLAPAKHETPQEAAPRAA